MISFLRVSAVESSLFDIFRPIDDGGGRPSGGVVVRRGAATLRWGRVAPPADVSGRRPTSSFCRRSVGCETRLSGAKHSIGGRHKGWGRQGAGVGPLGDRGRGWVGVGQREASHTLQADMIPYW